MLKNILCESHSQSEFDSESEGEVEYRTFVISKSLSHSHEICVTDQKTLWLMHVLHINA